MMYARVDGNIVAELIEREVDGVGVSDRFHPDIVARLVPSGPDAKPGWLWDGEAFAPPPPPEPPVPVVPASITRRQLLLALAGAGMITAEEALAAATTGAVPAMIDAVFAGLPEADALGARITWATMSVAERDHPLIAAMIAAGMVTAADVDELFILAATL